MGYPVINLLVTCVHISSETSYGIVHSHIEITLVITYRLCVPIFSSTVTTTGSLNIGKVHMVVGAA